MDESGYPPNLLEIRRKVEARAKELLAQYQSPSPAPAPVKMEQESPQATVARVEQENETLAQSLAAVEAAITAATGEKSDPAAIFEQAVIDALRVVRKLEHAEFQRLRLRIKRIKDVRVSDLDAAIRGEEESDREKETAAALVDMVRERCRLFPDQDGEPYAAFEENGHRQCWRITGSEFGEWLSYQHYKDRGRVPGDKPLRSALSTLAGVAKFEGEPERVFLRVAALDGAVWLDLCNQEWRAVEITATGWRIVSNPPVMFSRTGSMRPLPDPVPAGDLEKLWQVVNVPADDRLLVLAWLLECLRMETPYAVLELVGEEGTAKSSTQSALRDIIDPNRANLRTAPKNIDDVFVSARNAHIVSLNNLSYLKPDYQDALCCLATGGGYAGRTLYTNSEETVLDIKRPVMLNGIATIVTAQDLLGRTVHIDLPAIERRLSEVELSKTFEESKGSILGGLLDLFVKVLAELPQVKIPHDKRPRMADFAVLGEAVYLVSGKQAGEFLAYYEEKRRDGVHRTLDSSPVAAACMAFLEANPQGYDGTVKGLRDAVTPFKPDGELWPRSPKGFADGLRRVAPAMRLIGIRTKISERPGKHGYTCTLQGKIYSGGGKTPETSSPCSPCSPKPPHAGELGELGEPEKKVFPPQSIFSEPGEGDNPASSSCSPDYQEAYF